MPRALYAVSQKDKTRVIEHIGRRAPGIVWVSSPRQADIIILTSASSYSKYHAKYPQAKLTTVQGIVSAGRKKAEDYAGLTPEELAQQIPEELKYNGDIKNMASTALDALDGSTVVDATQVVALDNKELTPKKESMIERLMKHPSIQKAFDLFMAQSPMSNIILQTANDKMKKSLLEKFTILALQGLSAPTVTQINPLTGRPVSTPFAMPGTSWQNQTVLMELVANAKANLDEQDMKVLDKISGTPGSATPATPADKDALIADLQQRVEALELDRNGPVSVGDLALASMRDLPPGSVNPQLAQLIMAMASQQPVELPPAAQQGGPQIVQTPQGPMAVVPGPQGQAVLVPLSTVQTPQGVMAVVPGPQGQMLMPLGNGQAPLQGPPPFLIANPMQMPPVQQQMSQGNPQMYNINPNNLTNYLQEVGRFEGRFRLYLQPLLNMPQGWQELNMPSLRFQLNVLDVVQQVLNQVTAITTLLTTYFRVQFDQTLYAQLEPQNSNLLNQAMDWRLYDAQRPANEMLDRMVQSFTYYVAVQNMFKVIASRRSIIASAVNSAILDTTLYIQQPQVNEAKGAPVGDMLAMIKYILLGSNDTGETGNPGESLLGPNNDTSCARSRYIIRSRQQSQFAARNIMSRFKLDAPIRLLITPMFQQLGIQVPNEWTQINDNCVRYSFVLRSLINFASICMRASSVQEIRDVWASIVQDSRYFGDNVSAQTTGAEGWTEGFIDSDILNQKFGPFIKYMLPDKILTNVSVPNTDGIRDEQEIKEYLGLFINDVYPKLSKNMYNARSIGALDKLIRAYKPQGSAVMTEDNKLAVVKNLSCMFLSTVIMALFESLSSMSLDANFAQFFTPPSQPAAPNSGLFGFFRR